jgi:hypothetical protein
MPISQNAWHLVGLGLDFYVDVPGKIHWSFPVGQARTVQDPCTGLGIQILRGAFPLTELPARTGSLTWGAYWRGQGRTLRQVDRGRIEAAWCKVGPFALTTPEGETFNFQFIMTGNGLELDWGENGERIYTVQIQEVK